MSCRLVTSTLVLQVWAQAAALRGQVFQGLDLDITQKQVHSRGGIGFGQRGANRSGGAGNEYG